MKKEIKKFQKGIDKCNLMMYNVITEFQITQLNVKQRRLKQ